MRYSRERAFYRVEYPIQERPSFVIDGGELSILDMSEYGIRFLTKVDIEMNVGDILDGVIRFRGRAEESVGGEVVWIRAKTAALKLEVPIPFGTILSEQRYLRSRYRLME
jgi:hypothetical protein